MSQETLIDEALLNIREDRKKTEELLKELENEISNSLNTSHAKAGIVAAKYVETLQRSNEQLVKIITLIKKNQKAEQDVPLSKEERENIFELIKREVQ